MNTPTKPILVRAWNQPPHLVADAMNKLPNHPQLGIIVSRHNLELTQWCRQHQRPYALDATRARHHPLRRTTTLIDDLDPNHPPAFISVGENEPNGDWTIRDGRGAKTPMTAKTFVRTFTPDITYALDRGHTVTMAQIKTLPAPGSPLDTGPLAIAVAALNLRRLDTRYIRAVRAELNNAGHPHALISAGAGRTKRPTPDATTSRTNIIEYIPTNSWYHERIRHMNKNTLRHWLRWLHTPHAHALTLDGRATTWDARTELHGKEIPWHQRNYWGLVNHRTKRLTRTGHELRRALT